MAHSELAREKMWSRIHLIPLLTAEEDRDLVRRHMADQAREKELLGSTTSSYNSDRWAFLRPGRGSLLMVDLQIRTTYLWNHTFQDNEIEEGEQEVLLGNGRSGIYLRIWDSMAEEDCILCIGIIAKSRLQKLLATAFAALV